MHNTIKRQQVIYKPKTNSFLIIVFNLTLTLIPHRAYIEPPLPPSRPGCIPASRPPPPSRRTRPSPRIPDCPNLPAFSPHPGVPASLSHVQGPRTPGHGVMEDNLPPSVHTYGGALCAAARNAPVWFVPGRAPQTAGSYSKPYTCESNFI